jgi:hypothetical protein
MYHACRITVNLMDFREIFVRFSQNFAKIVPFSHDFRIFAKIEKCFFVSTLCTALWGGGGVKGVASSAALKIFLIKTQVTNKLSSKEHWNLRFFVKPLFKKVYKIFSKAFLSLNKLHMTSSTYFRSKNGSFYSIAVRIRVKKVKSANFFTIFSPLIFSI